MNGWAIFTFLSRAGCDLISRVNRLYFGDNLHVLRDRAACPDGCVDLIYLDPPFNSKRDYNLRFKSPK